MNNSLSNKIILVSGASSIIGYGILKSLKQGDPGYTLIATSIYEDFIAKTLANIFEKAPKTNDESYLSWLITISKKHKVDMIIPAIEEDVIFWNKHREVIEKETNAFILLNRPSLINLCADKWLFFQELKNNNCPYAIPTSLDWDQKDITFPILLKPRTGSASKGIVVVEDLKTFLSYKNEIGPKLMIQPIIGSPEEEFTTSAFFDKSSNLCAYMTLQRKLSKTGFTEIAMTADVDNIPEILGELAKIFKPVGPTNFQFRKSDGTLKLLEINPRISSATSIRAAFGYNESIMSVEYYLSNKQPVQPELKTGRAVRYTEDMIYYDSVNF